MEAMAALYAEDAQLLNPTERTPHVGPDGARKFWSAYRKSFHTIRSRFHAVLEAELDRLCRTVGWRLSVFQRGRNSRSSAGSMWMVGMIESDLDSERLRGCDEVSRREGKRAWTICMVRTADIVVLVGSEM